MNPTDPFLVLGVILLVLGAGRVLLVADPLRRLVALNIASSGVMLLLLVLAVRWGAPDPVPQALVLTGIVIMVSVTGLALALIRRIEADSAAPDAQERGAE